MEFMQRGGRPNQPVAPANNHTAAAPGAAGPTGKNSKKAKGIAWFKFGSIGLLFSLTVLVVAVIASLAFSKGSLDEFKMVDGNKYQAVFLNGGQVYFGRIKDLNAKTIRLDDIYYLRVNQQVQPGQQANANDVSLVKLGCELHGPQDQMLVNREQVVFWENLKDDGQVAKAVKQYRDQNPNGQKCDTASQPSTDASNAAPATAPPATNNATKKP